MRREVVRRAPVFVTWAMRGHVWNLRAKRCLREIQRAFLVGRKSGFQVVHYAVLGNHVHMLVEAEDGRALSRGMQGLAVRVARSLQRVMGKTGSVFKERFHSRVLKTAGDVKRVRLYIANNARRHYGAAEVAERDFAASQTPVHAPRTWIVRMSC